MTRVAKGIQQTKWGYRTYVRVKGQLKTKRWPRDTKLDDLKLWCERARAKMVLAADPPTDTPTPTRGTFRADALTYLDAVTALTTYPERQKHLHEWIALFGDTPTDEITSAAIRAQRDRWLKMGPRTVQRQGKRIVVKKPLSASSVNHRLRALENMWTVLWPGTPNPVRQVPEAVEPVTPIRAVSASIVKKIFAALPDGQTKARLEVLRWTGLPAKTLMRIKPEHVNLRKGVVWVPGRHKGQGTQGRVLPLLPEAVIAFRHLKQQRAFGEFSTSGMRSVFQRACVRARVDPMTPYQLRHSFGTLFLTVTQDLRATQHALGHSTPKLTERYAQGAVEPALMAAYAKVGRAVATKSATRRLRP